MLTVSRISHQRALTDDPLHRSLTRTELNPAWSGVNSWVLPDFCKSAATGFSENNLFEADRFCLAFEFYFAKIIIAGSTGWKNADKCLAAQKSLAGKL